MVVTLLGTGTSQGVPVIGCTCPVCQSTDPRDKRLRVSVLIEQNGNHAVIDTGPDFRQQMLRESVRHMNAVVFTHEHKDHIAGLDDIRAFNFVQRKAMDIYASERVQVALKRDFFYAFEDFKYPGVPELRLHTIENVPFEAGGITFNPIEVWHYKLPVLGFRVGDFTYITDANRIEEVEQEKIYGSRVIVLNALRKTKHISHFTLDEAVELLEKWKPERAYLTHLSHQMGFHEEIERELPDFIHVGYDGLKIELP